MRGRFWVRLGIITAVPLLFFLAATESSLLGYPLLVAVILLVSGFSLHCLGIFFYNKNIQITIIKISTLCFFCYTLFGWAAAGTQVEMAFEHTRITEVEGSLGEDSLLCKSGKQLLRLRLASCGTGDEAKGSAEGVLTALVKVDEVMVSGSRVLMQGKFAPDGSLFFADTLQVLSISRYRAFRRKLLSLAERRFTVVLKDEQSRSLAMMLLLGRSSDSAFPLKEMSLKSGCAHLLALSGMHLQFFIALLSSALIPLFGKRRGRSVSVILALFYVLLVGPKPSLVRAMGMAVLSLFLKGAMASYYSFLAAATIQTFLFPSAVTSMGSLLSYAAYGGLLCNTLFAFYRPKVFEPFIASAFAILFTAIPTLVIWGTWQIGALVVAPFASLLMFSLMGCSLLAFVGGQVFAPLVVTLQWLLQTVLGFGSILLGGALSLGGFGLYLFLVLTLLASIGYAERALQKRRRDSYELEIRLRFTEGHSEPARQGRARLEQEIWTEFSD
ncbi:MAG TPA: hypothetical protein GXZ69_00390 [Spirochaetales bacterium]|nr:hypothetical protein [Spirochaetales bacterium]